METILYITPYFIIMMESHEQPQPERGMKYCYKHMYWFPIEEGCETCKKLKLTTLKCDCGKMIKSPKLNKSGMCNSCFIKTAYQRRRFASRIKSTNNHLGERAILSASQSKSNKRDMGNPDDTESVQKASEVENGS